MPVELVVPLQPLEGFDEFGALGAAEIGEIQHSNMLPVPNAHDSHDLILRRIRFGRDEGDWQVVNRSGTNPVVDFDQRPRRPRIHHYDHCIGPKFRQLGVICWSLVVPDDLQNASALDDLLGSKFDRVEVTEDPVLLLQLLGGNEGLRCHFFLSRFTFTFDFSACAIFFCRLGILVAGFLGPCRSFVVIVPILSDSILPVAVRRR